METNGLNFIFLHIFIENYMQFTRPVTQQDSSPVSALPIT